MSIFVVIGSIYYLVQGTGYGLDVAGATILIFLGVAMAFVFAILLRGSREL